MRYVSLPLVLALLGFSTFPGLGDVVNPQLWLWRAIRLKLLEPDGNAYFDSSMKDTLVRVDRYGLKGMVVSSKPVKHPKELVLAMEASGAPEVTLKLVGNWRYPIPAGSRVEFEGIPAAFTKDPFMVTFKVELGDPVLFTVEAPPNPPR